MKSTRSHTPKRLPGFDYHRPYFYMVTIKRADGVWDRFSEIDKWGFHYNDNTRKILKVIKSLHLVFPEIAEVTTFTVMPDHLHLLIRIIDENSPHDLSEIVKGFTDRLSDADIYVNQEFHDYIVTTYGDLAEFTRYIRENPGRASRRMRAIEQGLFNRIRSVTFAGCEWYACGNIELLNLPEIVPFRGSRSILSGTPEWQAMINRAARLGPASAGVSTFVGTLEKKCAHEIALAGGNLIILSPRGFPPAGNGSGYDTPQGEPTRWHPPRSHEPFFAKGKILYLSQWAGTFHKLSNDEFFRRCHAMWHSLEGGMGGL